MVVWTLIGLIHTWTNYKNIQELFFSFFKRWFVLGYVIICDVMLVCVEVRTVVPIKELAQGKARKVSPLDAKWKRNMITLT